jgi:hypothetical protein
MNSKFHAIAELGLRAVVCDPQSFDRRLVRASGGIPCESLKQREMNRTNIRSFGLNRSPFASARPAVAAYQKRWFQRRRRRHDPWLVLNMSIFNFEPGRSEIFNPIRSHQNVWC